MVTNSFYIKAIMKNYTKKSILKLKPSSTLVINEKSKELIANGKKVYSFGFGQSPFPVPESIVSKLKENAHRKEYLPIQGLVELRKSISKYLEKKNWKSLPRRKYFDNTWIKRSNAFNACGLQWRNHFICPELGII